MEQFTWESHVEKIRDGICAYIARPGVALSNAGMVSGTRFGVFIDALGNAEVTHQFQQKAMEYTDQPIPLCLFTHSHGDHVFGAHGYEGVLHVMTQKAKAEADLDKDAPSDFVIAHSLIYTKEGSRRTEPHIVYEDHMVLELGGRTVELTDMGHCHTSSDVIAYVPEERIVFCGDILFNKIGWMGAKCNYTNWIAALRKISEMDADVFIPGHGPVATRQDVTDASDYLELLYESAKQGLAAGISPLDMAEDFDLGKYERWQEPERVVLAFEAMYRELTGKSDCPPTFNVHQERIRMAKEGRRVNQKESRA